MKSLRMLVVIAALALTACSGTPRPIVDTKGVDMNQYHQDMAECQRYAEEVDVAGGVARGAGLGAVVGGAVGAVTGSGTEGAATGAITGGATSGIKNDRDRERVAKNCMRGRGYRVLN
ncbi:MAG: glycine zipper family protein [Haliea sp.]|uniref:glycine zipper family protein n=1 Tax=Haliea sp. TaxID=1932666 RepID=UPI0032EC06DF